MNATSILAGLLVVAFAAARLGQARRRSRHARQGRARRLQRRRLPPDRPPRDPGRPRPPRRAFVPVIGALAAVGLLLLLGGAVIAHVRNGDGIRELAPAVVLGLVTLTFLLLVVGDLR